MLYIHIYLNILETGAGKRETGNDIMHDYVHTLSLVYVWVSLTITNKKQATKTKPAPA